MPLSPTVVENARALLLKLNAPTPLTTDKNLTPNRMKARAALIDAAEQMLTTEGVSSLQARPLAKAANIAVGSVYNLFDDLNSLIVEVNARTLIFVGTKAIETIEVAGEKQLSAEQTMFALVEVYMAFVEGNHDRWEATLRLSRATHRDAPLWYLEKQAVLFQIIAYVLADIPNLKPNLDLTLYSRTMWGAVNGLVTGGFHGALLGEERKLDRRRQVKTVLEAMIAASQS